MMVKQPKPEYFEFAERLVITCVAKGMTKDRLMRLTEIKKSRLNSYEDATRFFLGKEITMADGALRKISKALGVMSIWLTEGETSILSRDMGEKIEAIERLSSAEQLRRAQELGWWRDHGRPRKPLVSRPSGK